MFEIMEHGAPDNEIVLEELKEIAEKLMRNQIK